MVYFLLLFFMAISPIIVIYAVDKWYQKVDYPPLALVTAIYGCVDNGPLHGQGLPAGDPKDDRRARTNHTGEHPGVGSAVMGGPNPGRPGPPPALAPLPPPTGVNPGSDLCRAIKAIIDQSIDHDAIAELAAKKTCEKCGKKENGGGGNGDKPPLVLGGEGVAIEITDNPDCAGDVITGITLDNTPANPNQKVRFTHDDLDLPHFCPGSREHILGPNNNRRLNPALPQPTREWELLERPRVHHARTRAKPLNEDNPLIGGPYAVFIAKHLDGICCDGKRGAVAVRDKDRVTVFILYLDWVTEQPTIFEFDVEVERGKEIISDEDTVQLISNVRLNSIEKRVTFQIGEGARRIVVAGYDFNARSTSTDTGRQRRSELDTSGSYIIQLTDDAAVDWVVRRD